MTYTTIIVTETDLALTITINRPEAENAINEQLHRDINTALDLAESNAQCKVVILAGLPGFFCTGMDFEAVAAKAPPKDIEEGRRFSRNFCS